MDLIIDINELDGQDCEKFDPIEKENENQEINVNQSHEQS